MDHLTSSSALQTGDLDSSTSPLVLVDFSASAERAVDEGEMISDDCWMRESVGGSTAAENCAAEGAADERTAEVPAGERAEGSSPYSADAMLYGMRFGNLVCERRGLAVDEALLVLRKRRT